MAEDDRDRDREMEAEREAEINAEMERVDQDPDQVAEGSDSLGTQNAPSGSPRRPTGADEGGEENEDVGEDAQRTTDPTLLRSVVEEYGGYPAHVPDSENEGDGGLLRIGFRDRDEDLEEISWEKFREEIQEKELVGIYTEDGSDVGGDRPVVLRDRTETG